MRALHGEGRMLDPIGEIVGSRWLVETEPIQTASGGSYRAIYSWCNERFGRLGFLSERFNV